MSVTGAQLTLARELSLDVQQNPFPFGQRRWPGKFRIVTLSNPPTEDIYGDDFEKLVSKLDDLDVAQKTITCAAFFEFLYNTGWYGRFVEPLHDLAKAQEGKPMSINTVRAICVLQSLPHNDAQTAIFNFANGLIEGAIQW